MEKGFADFVEPVVCRKEQMRIANDIRNSHLVVGNNRRARHYPLLCRKRNQGSA